MSMRTAGKHIDPHVHCRDWKQEYKATIRSVMDTARRNGVVAVVDMPNTDPAITTEELVNRRIETAYSEGRLKGYYLYIGATADPDQLLEAACVVESNSKVLGIKMYAGKSVGGLEVSSEEQQRVVYSTLADIGYTGVVVLHCEKESLFKMELWDPERPYTWNLARPPIAEVESVRDQIKFVEEYNFHGHIHVCHISVPEAVALVNEARPKIRISAGVTPHHLQLSTLMMRSGAEGARYKVNPPLRDDEMRAGMMKLLRKGDIDWIETDHAPHSSSEKMYRKGKPAESYLSGLQSLETYSYFLDYLSWHGFSPEQINKLTYSNIKKVFPRILE